MTADQARELFSGYLENTLDASTKDSLQAFLTEHPECASELIAFERTLNLLHRTPPREPMLDMWPEFAPKLAEYQREHKMSAVQRMRTRWTYFLSDISTGVILWTHALFQHAYERLERYLLHDPSRAYGRNPGGDL